jgi:hypothetical protein
MQARAWYGQMPAPVAALVGCHKHGDSIWATCHCNPRFHAGIVDVEPDVPFTMDYRKDFHSLEAAKAWTDKEMEKYSQ